MNEQDQFWMAHALTLAARAESEAEVPVGALLVRDGALLAEGWNRPIACCDPTAHAEIQVLRQAALEVQNYRLPNTTLYVTLEPCTMCAGALLQARIKRLVFGAFDARAGAVTSVFQIFAEPRLNHQVEWQGGILQAECTAVLQAFFKKRR